MKKKGAGRGKERETAAAPAERAEGGADRSENRPPLPARTNGKGAGSQGGQSASSSGTARRRFKRRLGRGGRLPLATAAPNRGLQLASSRRSSIGPPAGGVAANHNAPFQSAGSRRGRVATTSVRMTRLQTAGSYWPAGGAVLLVLRRAAPWPIRTRRFDPRQGIKPGGGGGGAALSVSIASHVGSRQAGGQSPR